MDLLICDGITDLTDVGLTDFNNSGLERLDDERCRPRKRKCLTLTLKGKKN